MIISFFGEGVQEENLANTKNKIQDIRVNKKNLNFLFLLLIKATSFLRRCVARNTNISIKPFNMPSQWATTEGGKEQKAKRKFLLKEPCVFQPLVLFGLRKLQCVRLHRLPGMVCTCEMFIHLVDRMFTRKELLQIR